MGGRRGRAGVVEEPNMKQRKVAALASVIVEALKVDSLQRLYSSLEPLLRRIAIWPYNGHYLPTDENFKEFISFLTDNNVDLTDVKVFNLEPLIPMYCA